MATYIENFDNPNSTLYNCKAFVLGELNIYGSSRLGMVRGFPKVLLGSSPFKRFPTPPDPNIPFYEQTSELLTGNRNYECTNHLGNVLTVVSDRRKGINTDTDDDADSYEPIVISAQDYYPFGMEMPGRNYTLAGAGSYRFGFNGKEADKNGEWGSLTHYDYGFRIYNPGIGRFLSVDPLTKSYPSWTPYAFAMNRVIDGVDLDGLEYLDTDAALLEIKQGIILLKVENFNRISRSKWNAASNNTQNWSINCRNSNGCIGLSREVTSFKLVVAPTYVPSDLQNGASLDNTLDPAVDPTYNPQQQNAESTYTRPTKKDGTPDYRNKANKFNRDGGVITGSPSRMRTAARGTLVLDAIIFTLDQVQTRAVGKTNDNIKIQFPFATESLADLNTALRFGYIPDEFQNIDDLSKIANYILSGSTEGMSEKLIKISKKIWNDVSSPTLIEQDSGLDNFNTQPIDVNPYKGEE